MDETKDLKWAAKQALAIQDACNLSGLVHAFPAVVSAVRADPGCKGTRWCNTHPVVLIYLDKLCDLAGIDSCCDSVSEAYQKVHDLAEGIPVPDSSWYQG